MNTQAKEIIKEISQAANASVVGTGSGRRYTVAFKQKVADALGYGHISADDAVRASGASLHSVHKWLSTYHRKSTKTIAVSRSWKKSSVTVRSSNISIKSLEKRRIKAMEQFVKAKQDIEKIDKALAVLDSLDLSAL